MAKNKRCGDAVRAGRLEKAKQFRLAAEIVDGYAAGDVALLDAYVTLCVQAGIAAADAGDGAARRRLGRFGRDSVLAASPGGDGPLLWGVLPVTLRHAVVDLHASRSPRRPERVARRVPCAR